MRCAFPVDELFASIDDDLESPGSSLISRGLYPNRFSRGQLKYLSAVQEAAPGPALTVMVDCRESPAQLDKQLQIWRHCPRHIAERLQVVLVGEFTPAFVAPAIADSPIQYVALPSGRFSGMATFSHLATAEGTCDWLFILDSDYAIDFGSLLSLLQGLALAPKQQAFFFQHAHPGTQASVSTTSCVVSKTHLQSLTGIEQEHAGNAAGEALDMLHFWQARGHTPVLVKDLYLQAA